MNAVVSTKQHWESIYQSKQEDELSWFQSYPKTSMDFVDLLDLSPDAAIIDIGGGNSHFVDALLDKGYRNVWVLDISERAIEQTKHRLGERASKVHWVISDVTEFVPPVSFDLWHDRAAFHFLTTEPAIGRYVTVARQAIKKGGYLLLGTFSKTGPLKCSGLPIQQYSEESMSSLFETSFNRIKCVHEEHITPSQAVQNFLFCSFRKK